MYKKELLYLLRNCDDGTEIVFTIGNSVVDSKVSGRFRGSIEESDGSCIVLNFDECKREDIK